MTTVPAMPINAVQRGEVRFDAARQVKSSAIMGCSDDIEALSYSLSVMTWFCSKQDVKSVRDDMTTVALHADVFENGLAHAT